MKLAVPACLLLTACATNPGIVPAGGDSYLVSRSGYGFLETASNVKANVLVEADAFCSKKGMAMQVISESTKPAYPTHPPEAEVRFRCVPR